MNRIARKDGLDHLVAGPDAKHVEQRMREPHLAVAPAQKGAYFALAGHQSDRAGDFRRNQDLIRIVERHAVNVQIASGIARIEKLGGNQTDPVGIERYFRPVAHGLG